MKRIAQTFDHVASCLRPRYGRSVARRCTRAAFARTKSTSTAASKHYDNDNLPKTEHLSVIGPASGADRRTAASRRPMNRSRKTTTKIDGSGQAGDSANASKDEAEERQKMLDDWKKRIEDQKDSDRDRGEGARSLESRISSTRRGDVCRRGKPAAQLGVVGQGRPRVQAANCRKRKGSCRMRSRSSMTCRRARARQASHLQFANSGLAVRFHQRARRNAVPFLFAWNDAAFEDLPTMMMAVHGMELAPLLDRQRSEDRMIKDSSDGRILFAFAGVGRSMAKICGPISATSFSERHAFGCRLLGRCSPVGKISESVSTNVAKR